jgi:hypothetical protein
MAVTLTSTAYSAIPKAIHAGVNSVSIDFTSAAGVTFCASANATVVLGPKIANGMTILNITGSHSSGSDSCPVDIGVDTSLSKFATQKTQISNAIAGVGNVPFKVSITDTAATQYRVIKFAATPGTNTAVVQFKYTVFFTADP